MDTPFSESPTIFPLFPHLPAELRLKIWQHTLPTSRILKISYSPTHLTYISNTTPPITLSINHESRTQTLLTYTPLLLGPTSKAPPPVPISQFLSQRNIDKSQTPLTPLIPISFKTETLYISSLAPVLGTHLDDLLYNLSTSPARHFLQYIAFDLRVWFTLCDHGLLSVLAKMKNLKGFDMVVEFGRNFEGEVGFLEAPEWRRDLRWIAERAETEFGVERRRGRNPGRKKGDEHKNKGEVVGVVVRCVLLTKGGEQA